VITIGRIKTVLVKRITKQLVKEHPDEFCEDFDKNKEVLKKYVDISSTKIRNVVAGYASRLVKQNKEGKIMKKPGKEDLSKFY